MSQKGAQRTAKTILKVVPVKGVFRTLTGTARFDQLWIQSDPNGDPLAPIDAQSEPNGDQIFQSGASLCAAIVFARGGGHGYRGASPSNPLRACWLQESTKPVPGGSI